MMFCIISANYYKLNNVFWKQKSLKIFLDVRFVLVDFLVKKAFEYRCCVLWYDCVCHFECICYACRYRCMTCLCLCNIRNCNLNNPFYP